MSDREAERGPRERDGGSIPRALRELLGPCLPGIDLGAVRVVHGIPWLLRTLAVFEPAAVTVGRTIFVAPGRCDPGSLEGVAQFAHELVHVRQWREHGRVGFLARYLGAYLVNRLRGMAPRVAYEGIPLEMEARRRELEILSALGAGVLAGRFVGDGGREAPT